MKKGTENRCCGNCKRRDEEDAYGWAYCPIFDTLVFCGDVCDNEFVKR